MTLVERVRAQLFGAVKQAAETVAGEGNVPEFTIETPRDKSHGDYSANVAMLLAKTLKQAPRQIAEKIVSEISLPFAEKIEVAGAGFINFYLNNNYLYEILGEVERQGKDFGKTDYGQGKRYLVEFVSANPTGPMHIGNARGGALGDGIASILSWAGYEVAREFYVNDAGNQINKFALSLDMRYLQLYQDGIEMPEDSYHGEDIVNHAKNFAAIHGDQYVNASVEERRKALVEYALPLNIQGLKDDLAKYRIHYDRWFLESSLHENGEVRRIIELFQENGATYESEGALWFRATAYGADQDFVLVRSNGVPTYVVPDIAYHYNKLVTRGFDKAIDVLGADHHGYAPRLKAALKALGIDPARLDVVIMQMVRLVRDGEVIKASKRSGKAITLVTLLEEVPVDAARFLFNLRQADTHLEFDLDLAVAETNDNPVYYVQYAHARICSILNILSKEGIKEKPFAEIDASKLKEPQEIELLKKLAEFPEEIKSAARDYEPSRITRYAMDLAGLFHSFYNACRVKGGEETLMNARLKLVCATRVVLENALSILAVEAPDKM